MRTRADRRLAALVGAGRIEPCGWGVEVAGPRPLARRRLRWCGKRIRLCGGLVRRGRQVGARCLVAHRFLDGRGRLCGNRLARTRLLVIGSGLLRAGRVHQRLRRWRRRPAAERVETGGELAGVPGRQLIAALPTVFRARRTLTRSIRARGRAGVVLRWTLSAWLGAALGFGSAKGVRALETTRSAV
ncbi:hypothetical protein [Nocardia pseudovaccinii]|uniref:hypothetical protein n=1 Tax=Nocardia pseudovaccinii TaxID=189540 RepID=UPI0007A471A6|nr:hypothetical protein [Nocardia pseudovaccinii]